MCTETYRGECDTVACSTNANYNWSPAAGEGDEPVGGSSFPAAIIRCKPSGETSTGHKEFSIRRSTSLPKVDMEGSRTVRTGGGGGGGG